MNREFFLDLITGEEGAGSGDGDADEASEEGLVGIADSNPSNPWHTFTHVYVPYCTADLHLGDAQVRACLWSWSSCRRIGCFESPRLLCGAFARVGCFW